MLILEEILFLCNIKSQTDQHNNYLKEIPVKKSLLKLQGD